MKYTEKQWQELANKVALFEQLKDDIEIAKTEEGKKVISIYNHEGYQVANDSDYDAARTVQTLFKN